MTFFWEFFALFGLLLITWELRQIDKNLQTQNDKLAELRNLLKLLCFTAEQIRAEVHRDDGSTAKLNEFFGEPKKRD